MTEQMVRGAAGASPTLAGALTSLERDSTVIVRFRQSTMSGLNPGLVSPQGTNAAGQRLFQVTFDFGDISSLNSIPAFVNGGGVTFDDVIGHEIYAHVTPLQQGWVCLDPPHSTCSVTRENVIRSEIGRPPRRF